MSTVDVGDLYPLQHLVYDASGDLADATVVLTVTSPTGTTSTPSVTHASTGTYNADVPLSSAGVWTWVWSVSGAVVDVASGQVTAADPGPPVYASLALLRKALGYTDGDTTRDDLLQLNLEAASRAVEIYCEQIGLHFTLDAVATARTFPLGRRVICTDQGDRVELDHIGSTMDLVVELGDGTTWTATTDYETYPDNALARRQAIKAIVFPQWSLGCQRRMRVTARWGWPEIPSAVEQATLLTATRLAKRPGSPEGVAGSADWGLVRIPNLDPDVKALLMYLTDPLKVA